MREDVGAAYKAWRDRQGRPPDKPGDFPISKIHGAVSDELAYNRSEDKGDPPPKPSDQRDEFGQPSNAAEMLAELPPAMARAEQYKWAYYAFWKNLCARMKVWLPQAEARMRELIGEAWPCKSGWVCEQRAIWFPPDAGELWAGKPFHCPYAEDPNCPKELQERQEALAAKEAAVLQPKRGGKWG